MRSRHVLLAEMCQPRQCSTVSQYFMDLSKTRNDKIVGTNSNHFDQVDFCLLSTLLALIFMAWAFLGRTNQEAVRRFELFVLGIP